MAKREKDEKDDKKSDELNAGELSKLLIKEFNKNEDKLGKIAWNLASDDDDPTTVKEYINTGSTLLNYIISNKPNGGIPVGKLTEFSGEEASGKSLVCAHLIADCQRRGGLAIYIDTENSASPEFLATLGVNISELVYMQPSTVEEVGAVIEKTIIMARTKAPNRLILVIWDGIAATPTKVELEGEYELNMNVQLEKAKVLSKMMSKLLQTWGKERIAMVFTNQLKVKIGVMYGDPMITPGGKAVPYASSVRVRFNKSTQVDNEKTKEVYGIRTQAKVVKNRLAPPLRKCIFNIMFSSGIDDVGSWFEKLHECGEIEKDDSWCYLTSMPSGKTWEKKGVNFGKDRGLSFREKGWNEFVKSDPKIHQHILALIEKHMIVRYGNIPKDIELDEESLMDAEAVAEVVTAGVA